MNRDVAQLVSAPALGAGGPPFESESPDITKTSLNFSEVFCFIQQPKKKTKETSDEKTFPAPFTSPVHIAGV